MCWFHVCWVRQLRNLPSGIGLGKSGDGYCRRIEGWENWRVPVWKRCSTSVVRSICDLEDSHNPPDRFYHPPKSGADAQELKIARNTTQVHQARLMQVACLGLLTVSITQSDPDAVRLTAEIESGMTDEQLAYARATIRWCERMAWLGCSGVCRLMTAGALYWKVEPTCNRVHARRHHKCWHRMVSAVSRELKCLDFVRVTES